MSESSRWYFDVVVAGAATAVSVAGIAAGVGGVGRLLLAAPLVCFLPGYAVVAAVFPRSADGTHELTAFDERSFGLGDGLQVGTALGTAGRIALAVLCSLAVVSLVALVADVVGLGVALWPVLVGVVTVTGAGLIGAVVTRARVAPRDRFALSAGDARLWWRSTDRFETDPRWEVAVPNAALALGVVLLSASVGYAAVAPPSGQQFTEFYVQTENMTGQTRTLYPESYAAGQRADLDVFVGNHEGRDAEYSVVASLQRVEGENGSLRVVERRRLGTTRASVAAGDTERVTLSFTPPQTGGERRLVLYLYRGAPPSEVSSASAYRTLRLWVTVSEGSSNALAAPSGA